MAVVVLGGHVIVKLSKEGIHSTTRAGQWCRLGKMVVGGHVYVCMWSFFGVGQNTFPVAVCNNSLRSSKS